MKTIAVLSQKGGAGKTTLALHLAACAEADSLVSTVIDLDPQSSAAGWAESRKIDGPTVAIAHAPRLQSILAAARRHGVRVALIDTAPHSQSDALVAAQSSDAILIPCRPAVLDLRAIAASIQLAKLAGKPAAVVLNACPPQGTSAGEEAEEALRAFGVPVAPVRLTQRVAFSHALTAGLTASEFEPSGKAASEARQLYLWVCQFVGMSESKHEGRYVEAS
jgi:chromosome partitioning protein